MTHGALRGRFPRRRLRRQRHVPNRRPRRRVLRRCARKQPNLCRDRHDAGMGSVGAGQGDGEIVGDQPAVRAENLADGLPRAAGAAGEPEAGGCELGFREGKAGLGAGARDRGGNGAYQLSEAVGSAGWVGLAAQSLAQDAAGNVADQGRGAGPPAVYAKKVIRGHASRPFSEFPGHAALISRVFPNVTRNRMVAQASACALKGQITSGGRTHSNS
jgi:hypothetical protein